MFWEYSPSSVNIASDWLRAKSSPVDEEEIKIKMDDCGHLTEGSIFARKEPINRSDPYEAIAKVINPSHSYPDTVK